MRTSSRVDNGRAASSRGGDRDDWGYVFSETIAVTDDGYETLASFPRELAVKELRARRRAERRPREQDGERPAPHDDGRVAAEIEAGGELVLLVASVALERAEVHIVARDALAASGSRHEAEPEVRPVVDREVGEGENSAPAGEADGGCASRRFMADGAEVAPPH